MEAAGLTGDDYEGWNALLAENEISEDFREGLAGFAFQSGSAVLSEAEDNAFFSPLSLYYALAVLGTGAEGRQRPNFLQLWEQRERRIWPVSARRSFSGMCTRKNGLRLRQKLTVRVSRTAPCALPILCGYRRK